MLMGLLCALVVIIQDQLTKALVYGEVMNFGPEVVSPYFNIVVAWNTGVSFSMFNNMGDAGVYILSGFSLFVVAFLLYWLSKEQKRSNQIALGLVIGGALGNVIDRLRFGAVLDFLDVHYGEYHWPAFNLADFSICIGAALIIWEGFFDKSSDNGQKLK